MEFIQQPYQPGETITAIATPPGEGGVAIVRISGNRALDIADKIFSGPVLSYKSHTAHFGHVLDLDGAHVDDALVLVMRENRSYTGENTVEIHCHGGSLITRRVLDVAIKAGARAAMPGEFTFKAFINGKIDLAQAEAVQELIAAKNERAVDAASQQLQGNLSKKVMQFQQELTDIAAILEAWVDFPDEGLEFASMDEICNKLNQTLEKISLLIDTYHDGKIIHEGISLCLVGCPNAGKSSLMNALLDKERAIVTHIPGTTRDILEDDLRLGGLNFKLIDTAGIREGAEIIEQEGIRRSRLAIEKSDLVLLVLDINKGYTEDEAELLQTVPKDKTILIWNKSDLPHTDVPNLGFEHVVAVSAKKRDKIEALVKEINHVVWKNPLPSKEEIVVTNTRHFEALTDAKKSLKNVLNGLQTGISPEFVAFDMKTALRALGKVIGTNISEDILNSIFSKFCIGK